MTDLEQMRLDDALHRAHLRGRQDPLAEWLLDGLPALCKELAGAHARADALRTQVAELEDGVTELSAACKRIKEVLESPYSDGYKLSEIRAALEA